MTHTLRPIARATLLLAALGLAAAAAPPLSTGVSTTVPKTVPATVPPAPTTPAHTASPSGAVPPTVQRETLSNGLRIVVVPDRLAPVVTTIVTYRAGSNDAPPGFPGMAHALEHMMFRGSKGLDKDQLYELGDRLGGNYNANTEETVTNFTYTVPSADLGLILRAEALRMNGATIAQADWEQERGAIEQEVSRDLSSPMYEVMTRITAALFAGTPYEHDALGTRASFDKTDAAMLRKFYETWYHPNNATLVIAGDVDPAAAIDEARTAFGAIPRVAVPEHPNPQFGDTPAKTITALSNLPVGLAAIAFRMPGLASPDRATADILAAALGSQRGALFALSTTDQAIASAFEMGQKTGVSVGLAFGAYPPGRDPAPLLAAIRGVLADAAKGDIPDALIEAAKRQKIAQLAFASDNISGLAETWAQALNIAGLSSPDDVVRQYEAVTPADVRRLAARVLDESHAVTAIVTPRGANQPAAPSGFGGGETVGSPPDHAVTLPGWAAAALAEVHAPDPGTPPTVSKLPNGLQLIVQPEHVGRTVTVIGRIRNEAALQQPKGKEGVAEVAGELLNYGTTSLDRVGFQAAVDGIAGSVQAGTTFRLRVLSDRFEAGMKLLADNELHPAFPASAFTVVREQEAETVGGMLHSAPYLFERAQGEAIVPAGDLSLRQPTPESVGRITLDDVHAYYASVFRPDLATIVVMGDVTPEEARRVVAQSFGGWAAPSDTPVVDLPPVGPSKASNRRIPDPSASQDAVVLTETMALPVASPERYTLQVGNTVLGQGFSSRLFRDLRGRTGYVYSEDSQFEFSRTRGAYSLSFGADPKNVAAARALAVRDITEMQTAPVSDAELRRAKAQILRQLAMRRASVRAIAGQYLSWVELGLPLDSEQVAARQVEATTAAAIQATFARWMRPADLSEVVRGPAP